MKRKINFAIKSKKGLRPINQDNLVCTYNSNDNFMSIVCDGVGSVVGSEYASKVVVDTFMNCFEATSKIYNPTKWFRETLKITLNNLEKVSKAKNLPGIATTLALLIVIDDKFYTFNIGDTRIYKINKQEIKQYSYDHNYKNYLISKGVSNKALEAQRNRWYAITNFIDPQNPQLAKFDCNSGDLEKNQYFLICTDGVYSWLNKDIIFKTVNKPVPLVVKASLLNTKALNADSNDNVSNIIIRVK